MEEFYYIFAFSLLGLFVGCFLNLCIYRLPRRMSITSPPSHCPRCGAKVAASDLIPVLSYLFLRGSCRNCRQSISPLYPVVEIVTALLFVMAYFHFGISLLLVKYIFLFLILIVVSFIDIEHYVIPNRIIIVALAAGVLLNLLARDLTVLSAFLGMFSAAIMLLIPALITRGGIGGGDIKLAGVLGFYLGWPDGLVAVFLGCLLAGIMGMVLLLMRIKGCKDPIPLGPFLAGGTLITILKYHQVVLGPSTILIK